MFSGSYQTCAESEDCVWIFYDFFSSNQIKQFLPPRHLSKLKHVVRRLTLIGAQHKLRPQCKLATWDEHCGTAAATVAAAQEAGTDCSSIIVAIIDPAWSCTTVAHRIEHQCFFSAPQKRLSNRRGPAVLCANQCVVCSPHRRVRETYIDRERK